MLKNYILSLFLFIISLIMPVIVALIFHPLWIFSTPGYTMMIVSFIAQILNLFTPIYLILITKYFAVKNHFSIGIGVIVGLVALYGSIYLQFWNWGTATGMFQNPDWGTVWLVKFEVIVSTIILAIGMIILFIMKSKKI